MPIKTKIIIIISLVVVASVATGIYFSRSAAPAYEWIAIKTGSISQKSSASGQVVPAQEINLQFEIQGRIKKLPAAAGDKVKQGDVLASLDDSELRTQVAEAQAAVDVAKASLEKLLAGSSKEEIAVYQTTLDNAQVTLKNAQRDSEDVQSQAQNSLQEAWDDGLDALSSAYTACDKALKTYDTLQERYFYFNDSISFQMRLQGASSQTSLSQAKAAIDKAQAGSLGDDIVSALSQAKTALNQTKNALSFMRTSMEDVSYETAVSSADRTTVNTERTNVDTSVAEVTAAQQTISSQKIANQININTAQGEVDAAQNSVRAAQDNLTKIKAPARQVDIDFNQAQLSQAQAGLSRTQKQLAKTVLHSPIDGLIIDVVQKAGQTVTAQDTVVSIMTTDAFQVEVDVSEVDVARVQIGNPVDIVLDAFPNETFEGTVTEVDPAETVIQGVVYYKTKINFEKPDARIKAGMTANVDIVTQSKDNVLLAPSSAVSVKDGQATVKILENDKIQEVKVETGLRSPDGEIEIVSGLKDGDKVITFLKK